jgi:FkbM family methyltransferase
MITKLIRRARAWFFFKLVEKKKYPSYTLIEKFRELVYMKELLDDAAITTVIDVGANEGQFAQDLRKIGFKGKIISFEPGKNAFDILKANAAKDNLWTCYQYALGEKEGLMTFYIPKDTKLSSLLPSDQVGEGGTTEEVQVKRLDDVIQTAAVTGVKERFFLKLDTQGFDLEVFKGSTALLGEVEGLLSELSVLPLYQGMPPYKEALSIYENAGFTIRSLSIVARNWHKEVVELNAIMQRLAVKK